MDEDRLKLLEGRVLALRTEVADLTDAVHASATMLTALQLLVPWALAGVLPLTKMVAGDLRNDLSPEQFSFLEQLISDLIKRANQLRPPDRPAGTNTN